MSVNNYLVSVVVISYNAEMFIEEALNSVKNQTYKNIELIISDDSSSDGTNNIIKEWVRVNKNHFTKVNYIMNKINMGITANLNQAVKMSTGKYIKILASDDALFDNAITDLVSYCHENGLSYCFSNVLPFDRENSEKVKKIAQNDARNSDRFFNKTQKNQYRSLLNLTTPVTFTLGGFFEKQIIEELGYYDEKYPMQEDYSFALRLSKRGQRFLKADFYTYKYRVRTDIDEDFKNSKRYIDGYKCMRSIREDFVLKELINEKMYFSYVYLKITMFILKLEYEKQSPLFDYIAKFGRAIKQHAMNLFKL